MKKRYINLNQDTNTYGILLGEQVKTTINDSKAFDRKMTETDLRIKGTE